MAAVDSREALWHSGEMARAPSKDTGVSKTSDVDTYFARARPWREEATQLRSILRATPLDEALKWGKPCYGAEGKNIAIMQPMKGFLALMFFKGALLKDPQGLLQEQGENTRSALRLCFTSVDQVRDMQAVIQDFVRQAIEVERAGLTVEKSSELVLVDELQAQLDGNPTLRAAFQALTPGRQRAYNIYFAGAKRAQTRADRVAKCVPAILAGRGLRDD